MRRSVDPQENDMKKVLIAGAAAVLILSACAGAVKSDGSGSVPGEFPIESLPVDPNADLNDDASRSGLGEPGDTPPPADDSDGFVLGGEVPRAVQGAMADLAAHLGVSSDVIDWVSHEEVVWPDGSLGCPQPGMAYTQAIVSGSLSVFEVDGVRYEYHGATGSPSFLCNE